ncbi:MAG: type I glyceraldehyde-3-phosphate dehydrogenase [Candidatus Magasanikbacteria bacterium CG10_big_fil_rev_8_21_14_0_10_43_6]|uniref:Glyceraldehyde-3-phosphate dehydrogenase n=1 Tax=Candidatus Magasanikbacteria bacterium CG10_big_fil_rev_8_21_14_0_10_43_6 TaxID=1974650 RepID=A0A2M6W2E7_9BACT|nr:MAG: type I glyceraldehyde-3-phosphate dehydrogenase [Candidatus Magasanikbacteria bacterium CG10_big_fil_rev_8_21_14_0_10_43_6]
MALKVAINGFGRIGRIFTRVIWNNPAFELVAVNSRSEADIYAHLLKYDSIYGPWNHDVTFDGNDALIIDGKRLPMHHADEIMHAPWDTYNVDVVIESTGVFRDRASSETHLESGAKHVLISAPAKEEDITMIHGINDHLFDPAIHKVISAASCTTTCLAPIVQVLSKAYGIKHGTIMTTHAYTNDQHLVDYPHKDKSFRRARAAAMSIIPTSTGAAKAIAKVIPEMEGKLDGNALRVPVAVPSIISFIAELETPTNREAVNAEFHRAAKEDFPGNLAVCDIGLVSADYIGNPHGSTVDTLSTLVTGGTQVFIQAWYDNEWGYVVQMSKLLEHMGKKII